MDWCMTGGTEMKNVAVFHWMGPVSYTHLRAHETGRNLVCRLLLEKKKTKKKTDEMLQVRIETA